MYKSVFVSVFALALCTGVQAQTWAQKWEWPLVPVQQKFNVGDTIPSEPGIGGVGHYWQYPDPAEAAVLPSTTLATKPQAVVTSSDPVKTPAKP